MNTKMIRTLFLFTLLGTSSVALAANQSSIIVKTGSFTLGSKNQTIISAVTFDETSSNVFAIEYEARMNNDMSWGVEYITYKNDYTTGLYSGSATGTHIAGNFRKYFSVSKHVQPYIGAGISAAAVRLGGEGSGTAGGLGFQAMGGVKFPFDTVSLVVEYKIISSEPEDSAGASVDTSGNGLFAGIAVNF